MADRMLFLGWDAPARGREARALEVFNESVGLYGRLQQEGRIESFDVRLLLPNGGLDGYFEIRGSAEQLSALKQDPQFLQLLSDAGMCVDGIRLHDGVVDQGVADMMALYERSIDRVGATA